MRLPRRTGRCSGCFVLVLFLLGHALAQISGQAPTANRTLPTSASKTSEDATIPLGIAQKSFPDAMIGVPYQSSVQAVGGSGIYDLSATGDMPPGLSMETGGSTIAFGGVPTTVGTYQFQITIVDANGTSFKHDFSIQVFPRVLGAVALATSPHPTDAEGITVTDVDAVFLPAKVLDNESITLTDAVMGLDSVRVVVNEVTTLTDTVTGLDAARVADAENITLTDGITIGILTEPRIYWNTPAPITYGTALTATQLDATGSVDGKLTYNPPAGTVLSPGQHTLTVTLIPNNTSEYADATDSVTLTVDPASPTITSVSPIVSAQTQTITIAGSGFGTQAAYTGDSAYIQLTDSTSPFVAGHTGNGVTLAVSSWTDSQIVLTGMAGSYGTTHCIRPGDQLSISVWNVQTDNGPATYSLSASGATDNCPTSITSVSPIVSAQTQTITITGEGFGSQAAYTGDSNYIELVDNSGTPWSAGYTGKGIGLAVSSWTDSQIVITGLTGSYGTAHCIRPGDSLSVNVWNVQTGTGPVVYPIVASGGTDNCPTEITYVSPIYSHQTQTITITGEGFGTQAAYTGDSNYIEIADNSEIPWSAGHTGNGIDLAVSSWTDKQIVITGFTGNYGTTHCIRPGDQLSISVWNAQTGAGPVVYPIVASGLADNCPTKITSISAILPQQTQTITITGEGFGTQAAYTGDSKYIQVTDTTRSWNAGYTGNGVTLVVTSWTDYQIVLGGFAGSFGANHCIAPGDHLTFSVWNVESGAGPVVYPVVASSGTSTCP